MINILKQMFYMAKPCNNYTEISEPQHGTLFMIVKDPDTAYVVLIDEITDCIDSPHYLKKPLNVLL